MENREDRKRSLTVYDTDILKQMIVDKYGSIRKFCKETGACSPSTLSSIFKEKTMSPHIRRKLAEALEVDVLDIPAVYPMELTSYYVTRDNTHALSSTSTPTSLSVIGDDGEPKKVLTEDDLEEMEEGFEAVTSSVADIFEALCYAFEKLFCPKKEAKDGKKKRKKKDRKKKGKKSKKRKDI